MSTVMFDPSENHFSINVTESAVTHFLRQLDDTNAKGVRVSVKPSGCSGYMYVFDLVNEINNSDILLSFNDLSLYIDNQSTDMLKNCIIDYVKEGINRFVKVTNPQAVSECGCGESFTLS